MTREELLKSPDYWTTHLQMELYDKAVQFMEETGKNRKQLAEYLGVSASYITQLLNGDFNHRLSKFVELSVAFGYIPKVNFVPVIDCVEQDAAQQADWSAKIYAGETDCKCVTLYPGKDYFSVGDLKEKEVA